jgi:YfiH family protein
VDCRRRIVGNLHAGWRGTLRGITASAIRQLLEKGSDIADLRVAFGPAIGSCCYEVGPEVVAAFRAQFPGADTFFSRPVPNRDRQGAVRQREAEKESKFLNLQKANFAQAIGIGLRPHQVFRNAYCTHCDPETFYSYRRDGAKTGRMFALIGIQ